MTSYRITEAGVRAWAEMVDDAAIEQKILAWSNEPTAMVSTVLQAILVSRR